VPRGEPGAPESATLLELFVDEAERFLATAGDASADARASLAQVALLLEGEPLGAEVAAAVERLATIGAAARGPLAELVEVARGRLRRMRADVGGVVAATFDETFNTSEYRALRNLFRDEAREALEHIARRLLAGAAGPERDDLDELLRRAHSLKGAAGTVGLSDFGDAMHRLESAFDRVRRGERSWSTAVRDQLVDAVDALRAEVERGEGEPGGGGARQILGDLAPEPPATLGRRRDDSGVLPLPPRSERAGASALPPRSDPAFLRVDPARIDRLMDSVGELVFDRTRIERRASELAAVVADLERLRQALGAEAGALADELEVKLAHAARAIAELGADTDALRRTAIALQDGLTSVRMESARGLYQRLAPQLRAIARAAGKRVDLITTGGETEFDKSVADEIVDPMIHLLRNAVAHGIETSDVRLAVGKPAEGCVTLSARQEAGGVVIEVTDDGAGIDPEVLRRRLVAAGRWTAAQASLASTDEVLRALFDARLSSREQADELAGRGIGLDAVREVVARLGGELGVRSTPGVGTSFTMRLPLTTAVSNALLFKVADQVYAVPNVHVLDTVQVETSSPVLPPRLRVADATVPLVALHAVLGARVPADARAVPAVVIEYLGRRLAMTCDKIVGPREIVVKHLGPLLAPLPLFAGGTISGSGKVQLILDPSALIRIAYPEILPAASRRSAARVLLADDSRSIRESVRRLLEQAGFAVDAVENGRAAWEQLGRQSYDALVTDLDMPELDGFGLIEKVRGGGATAELPVIIITSQASSQATARAEALAVRHVLEKPISADRLLAALVGR
jgi:tape measure domain-containing protein